MSDIEPSWDFYRSFLAVLDGGSLSAAARTLGLTQPTVGRHVDALEQALGLPLFTRSPQGLLATEAALALKPYAESLAATTAALLRVASSALDAVEGTVRISASDVIGVEVLPPILAALQELHPKLTIELSLSDTVEDLLRREADIAVRMVEPQQEALIVRRIGNITLGAHAHPRYLDRHGVPKNLGDLSNHRLIGFDRQTAQIRAMGKRMPVLAGLHYAFRVDSNVAQLAAIRAGLGIGVCQVNFAAAPTPLVRLLADDIDLPLGCWITMHENLKTSPRCRVTFDALVQGLLAYVRRQH